MYGTGTDPLMADNFSSRFGQAGKLERSYEFLIPLVGQKIPANAPGALMLHNVVIGTIVGSPFRAPADELTKIEPAATREAVGIAAVGAERELGPRYRPARSTGSGRPPPTYTMARSPASPTSSARPRIGPRRSASARAPSTPPPSASGRTPPASSPSASSTTPALRSPATRTPATPTEPPSPPTRNPSTWSTSNRSEYRPGEVRPEVAEWPGSRRAEPPATRRSII